MVTGLLYLLVFLAGGVVLSALAVAVLDALTSPDPEGAKRETKRLPRPPG